MCRKCYINCQPDHNKTKPFGKTIDQSARFFIPEYCKGNNATDDCAILWIYPGQYSDAETATGNIADIKDQPAECDQECKEKSKTWKNLVGNILCPVFAYGHDPPDVYLSAYIQEDGNEDNETKAREQLFCK